MTKFKSIYAHTTKVHGFNVCTHNNSMTGYQYETMIVNNRNREWTEFKAYGSTEEEALANHAEGEAWAREHDPKTYRTPEPTYAGDFEEDVYEGE